MREEGVGGPPVRTRDARHVVGVGVGYQDQDQDQDEDEGWGGGGVGVGVRNHEKRASSTGALGLQTGGIGAYLGGPGGGWGVRA